MTVPHPLNDQATLLRSLHGDAAGTGGGAGVLVLPTAWDAGSAALLAAAGAPAVGTTSGGIAWSLGSPDGEAVTRDAMAAAVRRITAAVDVPVTADVEAGYGPAPEDVAATVRAVVRAGAAGISLEDSRAPGGPLFPPEEQAARIRAARAAAVEEGVPDLVVNARTDVFLFGIGAATGRADAVLARGGAYAAAGADCVFVPGLLDLTVLKTLTSALPVPLNAMAMPGGPDVRALAGAGVRRVSLGTALAQAAYGAAQRAARELLTAGTCGAGEGAPGSAELNGLFTR